MIVLSVGMPRAGSAWHYNLTHDLMRTAGADDARDIRMKFHLQDILTEVNCNIGVLSARRLALVSIPALLGHTFVIKAHSGPTRASRLLQSLGLLRITYIYRDPRDAMLSAFDYGQRALSKGHPNAFSHLTDFEKSLEFIREYVDIWEKWVKQPGVMVTRYEDLLANYDVEAFRLVEFLKLDAQNTDVREVIEHYRPSAAESQQGLHFYKGRAGRFRQAYTTEQQAVLSRAFGAALSRMGYPL
jgi:hypothetical protein